MVKTDSNAGHSSLGRWLIKLPFLIVAAGLAVLVVVLFAIGMATGWLGTKPYPYDPNHGAFLSSKKIVEELEYKLSEGTSLDDAEKSIPWNEVLTHWHAREDVLLQLKSSDGTELEGEIRFKATDRSPGFVYHVKSGKLEELK